MKQYEAYLFDLYGTLVDIHTDEGKPGFWKKVAAFYTAHDAVYDKAELRQEYLRLCREETNRICRKQGCSDREAEIDLAPVFSELYQSKGVLASDDLIAETAWFFRRSSTCHLRAYAGARALLLTLRSSGKRVFLLSNAQALFTRPELELLNLADCFDEIYISSDCGYRKPAKEFIQRLLTEQKLDPQNCLMIGNDPNADVEVARRVGMDSYYIRSGQSPKTELGEIPASCTQPRMDLRLLGRRLLSDT